MKALKTFAWIIGVLVFLFLVLIFIAPTRMHVEATVEIDAPASIVWNDIVRFEKFNEWSAWKQMDSTTTYTILGDDGTVGATYSWNGKKIGEGKLQHLSLEPYKLVQQKLTFIKPFKSEADVSFNLFEAGKKTKVVWSFDARYNRPQNLMSWIMKGAFSSDFQKGLNNLKSMAEADKRGPGSPNGVNETVKEMNYPATTYAAIRKSIPQKGITAFYRNNLKQIYIAATAAKLQPGVPCGLFFAWDTITHQADMAAAVPVPEGSILKGGGIQIIKLPAAKAYYVDYYGPYDKIANAHVALHEYADDNGKKIVLPIMEMYVTDPANEKDSSKWLTKVIYFMK
ncbi:SRPBCC family protein [Chitinophaga sp. Cy-1792]|uniref:SRPBCC family protein n=1 Tax=Chitinophaga sp. Cy-1792 TaxID=2608339 RepID=UPI001422FAEC|nr:SRPBCC family protein [Chitinophaga sp. Cy-1792]NIG52344.1 hypothetical protein [Chitinophaga sp. Cy-1792]